MSRIALLTEKKFENAKNFEDLKENLHSIQFSSVFYVFASPWKSMHFFIRFLISPYLH